MVKMYVDSVCMYAYMYVRMCVCMYVSIYVIYKYMYVLCSVCVYVCMSKLEAGLRVSGHRVIRVIFLAGSGRVGSWDTALTSLTRTGKK